MKVTVVGPHTVTRRVPFKVKGGFRQSQQQSFPVKGVEGGIEGDARAEWGTESRTCRIVSGAVTSHAQLSKPIMNKSVS